MEHSNSNSRSWRIVPVTILSIAAVAVLRASQLSNTSQQSERPIVCLLAAAPGSRFAIEFPKDSFESWNKAEEYAKSKRLSFVRKDDFALFIDRTCVRIDEMEHEISAYSLIAKLRDDKGRVNLRSLDSESASKFAAFIMSKSAAGPIHDAFKSGNLNLAVTPAADQLQFGTDGRRIDVRFAPRTSEIDLGQPVRGGSARLQPVDALPTRPTNDQLISKNAGVTFVWTRSEASESLRMKAIASMAETIDDILKDQDRRFQAAYGELISAVWGSDTLPTNRSLEEVSPELNHEVRRLAESSRIPWKDAKEREQFLKDGRFSGGQCSIAITIKIMGADGKEATYSTIISPGRNLDRP